MARGVMAMSCAAGEHVVDCSERCSSPAARKIVLSNWKISSLVWHMVTEMSSGGDHMDFSGSTCGDLVTGAEKGRTILVVCSRPLVLKMVGFWSDWVGVRKVGTHNAWKMRQFGTCWYKNYIRGFAANTKAHDNNRDIRLFPGIHTLWSSYIMLRTIPQEMVCGNLARGFRIKEMACIFSFCLLNIPNKS